MKAIIDRFEGEYAVCEGQDKKIININKKQIPRNANEGDVLIVTDGKVSIDILETQKLKKEVEDITKDLWE